MIVKREIIYSFAAVLLSLHTLHAQVNKQVEVTKEYIPQIESKEKITLDPEMAVDGSITPDIDYSITPRSIETTYDVKNYDAVKINFWEYEPYLPLYVKLGGGAPASVVGDIYYTHILNEDSHLIGFVNYNGQYGKIDDIFGVKQNATESQTSVGGAYQKRYGERLLNADVTYNNDYFSRYATNREANPIYQNIAASGRWGDDFMDIESFNYAMTADIKQHWNNSEYYTTLLNVGGEFAHLLGHGSMLYNIEYNQLLGSYKFNNSTIGGGLSYNVESDGGRLLKLGAKIYYDNVSYTEESNSDFYVIPDVTFDLPLKERKAVLFATADGDLIYNNYASLSEENPYIAPNLFETENSVEYRFSGGLKGSIFNNKLGYKGDITYRTRSNNTFWAFTTAGVNKGYEVTNYFDINSSTLNDLSLNLDLTFDPHSNLSFRSDMVWRMMINTPDQTWCHGLSNFEFRFGGDYRVGRFTLGADLELLSKRETTIINSDYSNVSSVGTIPTTVDLSATVEYSVKRRLNIFCNLNNLLNDDLYDYFGYKEYGIGFVAGVRVMF